MSAWVPSKIHFDLLIRAALHARPHSPFRWWRVDEAGKYASWRELDQQAQGIEDEGPHPPEYMVQCSPSAAGQVLVSECIASVSHRYPDEDSDAGELPGPNDAYYMAPYVYSDPSYTLTPGEVFQAVDCLDYQSCEHPGWETSEAYAFLRSLRQAYCERVEGYDTAPWGWEEADVQDRLFAATGRLR